MRHQQPVYPKKGKNARQFFEGEEGTESKEKENHRGTENTEGHGEKLRIWMEGATTKAKTLFGSSLVILF